MADQFKDTLVMDEKKRMIAWELGRIKLKTVLRTYPAKFGCRAHDWARCPFTIDKNASYVNQEGYVFIILNIRRDGKWMQFGRVSLEELDREITIFLEEDAEIPF